MSVIPKGIITTLESLQQALYKVGIKEPWKVIRVMLQRWKHDHDCRSLDLDDCT